MEGELFI